MIFPQQRFCCYCLLLPLFLSSFVSLFGNEGWKSEGGGNPQQGLISQLNIGENLQRRRPVMNCRRPAAIFNLPCEYRDYFHNGSLSSIFIFFLSLRACVCLTFDLVINYTNHKPKKRKKMDQLNEILGFLASFFCVSKWLNQVEELTISGLGRNSCVVIGRLMTGIKRCTFVLSSPCHTEYIQRCHRLIHCRYSEVRKS